MLLSADAVKEAVVNVKRISVVAAAGIVLASVSRANASPPTQPPIRLKASAASCSEVDLQWTDNPSDETGFTIERSGDPPGSWTVGGTTGPNARAFSDVGLSPFTTYYYRVRAYNVAGPSRDSDIVKGKTKHIPHDVYVPGVPANVTAVTGSACNSITVSWTASTDVGRSGLKGYTVHGSGGFTRQVAAPATSVDVTGLAPSGSYSFAVTATDYAGNDSARSETAVAATRSTCSGTGGTTLSAAAFTGQGSLAFSPRRPRMLWLPSSCRTDGRHVWSRRFVSLSGRQNNGALAATANGDIVLAGQIEGSADYGVAVITADGPVLLVLGP